MTVRFSMIATAALALLAGCGKKDAPPAAQPVTPAPAVAQPAPGDPSAKPAEPAPGDPAADPNKVVVKDLKVGPVPEPGTGPETPAAPEEPRITGPAALVNGQAIDSAVYYEEVDKILRRSSKIPPERMNRIKENILKRLIEQELIDQAVKAAAVVVPQPDIDKEFEEYKQRFRTDEQFQNYLTHGKVTIESIKDRIREKKELEMLLEKTGKLAVDDAEAQDFYAKNERFYQEREGIHARHVLIKVAQNAPKEEEDAALKKVKEAQELLKKGTKFEDVANKFSDGPSAPKGGDLGFFGRGQMVKPFEDKAFTMKVGEISEPIRTRFGYHIIEILEKREARKKPFDEVKDTIKESLRNKKFFQERRTLLAKLQSEAKIEEKVQIPKAPPTPPSGVPGKPEILDPRGGDAIPPGHPAIGTARPQPEGAAQPAQPSPTAPPAP